MPLYVSSEKKKKKLIYTETHLCSIIHILANNFVNSRSSNVSPEIKGINIHTLFSQRLELGMVTFGLCAAAPQHPILLVVLVFGVCISLLSEQNLISPFLSFFSF